MFGRSGQAGKIDGHTTREWRWPRSDRAEQRERRRAESELISEVRWQWRCACQATTLAPMIYTPSGATRAVPTIGRVDIGPPVSFTVRIRPGQSLADFTAAAPIIASAMGVAAVEVTSLVPQWVRIVLPPAPLVALPYEPSESHVEPLKLGA